MRKIIIAGIFFVSISNCIKAQIITTVAGRSGDYILAVNSSISNPDGVAVDAAGNVYIVDQGNQRVRKLNISTGIITTLAGDGAYGNYVGDGGIDTSAEFYNPASIAIDSAGNIYIADQNQDRIRKVTISTGIITTVVGNGTAGYSGDGGSATGAQLYNPNGIALDDSGNIYIADWSNNVIRKVTAKTGIISTIAGTGTAGYFGDGGKAINAKLSGPKGQIAIDSAGNVYFADENNNRIRKITVSTGIITTLAGGGTLGLGDGGPATSAQVYDPRGLGIDASGNIYIADDGSNRIRKVTVKTGIINTIAGNGTAGYSGDGGNATSAEINNPDGITIDSSGNLYISDYYNNLIRKVTISTGIISTITGNGLGSYGAGFNGDSIAASSSELTNPSGLVIDASGNILIADNLNNRIRKINSSTGIITTIAGNGIQGFSGDGSPATSAELNYPGGLALDDSGNVYVVDENNNRIRKINISTGIINTVIGNGTWGFGGDGGPATLAALSTVQEGYGYTSGIAVDDSGNIYFADINNSVIRKVTVATGIINTVAGTGIPGYSGDGGKARSAELYNPAGIAIDSLHNIYIADYYNHRIRKVNASTGIINTIAGNGTQGFSGDGGNALSAMLNYPIGLYLSASGDLYITDQFNHRVRKVTASTNVITTIAGNGRNGYNGDGFAADSAEIGFPSAITVDASNNVYIADNRNNRIREVLGCKSGFDLTGCLSVCIDTPKYNSASIEACIFNDRCMTVNGTLKLVIDTAIHIKNIISDSVAKISGDTLTWSYDNLSYSNKTHCVSLSGTVDSLPAGDSVSVTMIINPIVGDSVPSNNKVTYWVKSFPYNCVGLPFDPNEKSVYPLGNISATQKLTYGIRFQNTGTAIAKNVVVIDTLSANVDPTTLSVLSSSSPMTVQIVSGHIVKFIFDNIFLPDTAMSKTTSIGTLSYTILPASSVVPGEKILNSAGIYFDANPVVKTNTTINVISGSTAGILSLIPVTRISCFPNPFTTTTSVVFNTDGAHYLEVDDITGRRIVSVKCSGRQYELSRNGLAQGIYMMRAYDEEQKYVATTKVVVQ